MYSMNDIYNNKLNNNTDIIITKTLKAADLTVLAASMNDKALNYHFYFQHK